MTSDPRMTAILEDLAAGRIDAAEAARRIDTLKAAEQAAATPTRRPRASRATRSSPPPPPVANGSAESGDTDRPLGGEHRPAAAHHAHHRELRHAGEPVSRRRSRRAASRSTPTGSTRSPYGRSVAGCGSSGSPRSPPWPPTGRTCCAATARCWRSPATVSWAPPSTGSASSRRPAQPGRVPLAGARQGAVPAGQPRHRGRRRGHRRQPEHRAGTAPRQGPGDRRRGQAARRRGDQ